MSSIWQQDTKRTQDFILETLLSQLSENIPLSRKQRPCTQANTHSLSLQICSGILKISVLWWNRSGLCLYYCLSWNEFRVYPLQTTQVPVVVRLRYNSIQYQISHSGYKTISIIWSKLLQTSLFPNQCSQNQPVDLFQNQDASMMMIQPASPSARLLQASMCP